MGVGGLRLSEELTVFALGANHEIDYQISLVAASGTAKKGAKALHMQPMLETVLTEWRRKGQDSRGRVVDIVKDGASIMNAAVFPLVTTCTIDRSSAVGKHLFGPDSKGMLLFYDRCGNPDDDDGGDYGDRDGRKRKSSWPLVDSCDDKHFLKRFRQALGRSEGVRIKDWAFNKLLLSRLLVEVGNDETKVRTMFGDGEEDSQNVAAAVQLLLAIGSFRSKSAADFSDSRTSSPTFQPMLRELKILAEYCATEFEVVTMQSADKPGTFLTLSALNQSFSKLAHMAFALFRENGSKFVPPQHYYNTQITMRAKYVSQAVSKAEGIEQYFSYQVTAPRAACALPPAVSRARRSRPRGPTALPLRGQVVCASLRTAPLVPLRPRLGKHPPRSPARLCARLAPRATPRPPRPVRGEPGTSAGLNSLGTPPGRGGMATGGYVRGACQVSGRAGCREPDDRPPRAETAAGCGRPGGGHVRHGSRARSRRQL